MMKIVDTHTHAFPDSLAERAMEALKALDGNHPSYSDGTISGLKESMRRAGVSRAWVMPVATKPSQVHSINNRAREVTDGQIVAFGALHPDLEDWEEEIRRIKALGLPGVKMHPDYQNFRPDEPRMFPMYEALRAEGLILFFHAGDDIAFQRPGFGSPERIARVLREFPGLKVVAAHLGGFRRWRAVEEYLVGKEVFLETSFTFGHMACSQIERIIRQHGPERVLFGTDSPWKDQRVEVQNILSLRLTDRETEMILGRNAEEVLKG